MLYRYSLQVALDNKVVFDGNFSSINQMVKFACSFTNDCVMESFDSMFDKVIPIYSLIAEFRRDSNGI